MKLMLFSPMNLSYWWNLGSLLLMLILIQISSGILLTLFYENSVNSFLSLWMIHIEVFFGAFFHYFHLNFASFIFLIIYLHMIKGFLYNSYLNLKFVWFTGWALMILFMMIAFLGYVLPWGQMSLWGATVITNLFSALPMGVTLVQWIWGGYFVSIITLKLFFSLHFILPIMSLMMIMLHMIILHYSGSSNPLGVYVNTIKLEFSLNYLFKDMMNFIILMSLIIFLLLNSVNLSDPENFILANSMISPIHIQPEWYFLQYYAILRAIPNKMGGIIMFALSLFMILFMVFFKMVNNFFNNLLLFMNLNFFMINLLLVWLGGQVVEEPFLMISQVFTLMYFMWFFVIMLFMNNFKL